MKKIVFVLFFGIFSLYACSVLDQESPNDVAEENVLIDASSLRAARIGMYSTMQQRDYYGGYFPLIIDAYSDNGATGGFDNPALSELGEKKLTESNIFIQNIWLAIYATVNTTNHILAKIDNVNMEQTERDNIKGEALFVRALAHFDALRTFGEHWDMSSTYGVPIVTKVQKAEDILGRSKVSDCYTNILNDLIQAEKLTNDDESKGKSFVSKEAVQALLARVYLYAGDKTKAANYATQIIDNENFRLYEATNFAKLYTDRQTSESIFELSFDSQNRSSFNISTYSRPDALRTEVLFLAAADLKTFFENRTDDVRAATVDYENNDTGISPDGRTQKYRGEQLRDNPAYILRLAEMYLIRAEAKGNSEEGLADLNKLREARSMTVVEATTNDAFDAILADERRSELNFEGHRFFDLARTKHIEKVLGNETKPIFPIPQREIVATNGILQQHPLYK